MKPTRIKTMERLLACTDFPLAKRVVIHASAADRLDPDEIVMGLDDHAAADWDGDIVPDTAHGDRLVSAYGRGDRRFWIITEADRSVTTVLLAESVYPV
jgi:hypothetical protein